MAGAGTVLAAVVVGIEADSETPSAPVEGRLARSVQTKAIRALRSSPAVFGAVGDLVLSASNSNAEKPGIVLGRCVPAAGPDWLDTVTACGRAWIIVHSSEAAARRSRRRVSSVTSFWKKGRNCSVRVSASSPSVPASIQPPNPLTFGDPSAWMNTCCGPS